MSYRIEKAKKMRSSIVELEKEIELNARALQYAKASNASKSCIQEFISKGARLRRQLDKISKKYKRYADDNLKISDLPVILGREDIEDFEYDD